MSGALLVTITVGLLAALGLAGILVGAALRQPGPRRRSFRVGSVAMTIAGVLLMLASLVGLAGTDQLFGGLMMALFGTGASLPAVKDAAAAAAQP
jgi:hypothetical protein